MKKSKNGGIKLEKLSSDSEEMALFRYSIIVPALNETYTEKSVYEYFLKASTKEYTLPNGTKRYFNVNSLRNWYYRYRKYRI